MVNFVSDEKNIFFGRGDKLMSVWVWEILLNDFLVKVLYVLN